MTERWPVLHICRPATYNWRTRFPCPTCGRYRWALVSETVWYGTRVTCLGCGDRYGEDGRYPRPFERAWRPRAIARAKAHPYTTKTKAKAALWAEVQEYAHD